MQITGIILAGGKSSRMGTDKALLEIDGKPLLERSIELLRPICSTILVSSNHPQHQKFGVQIIPDEKSNCGPLAGIHSCLKESETDWNFVISVDAAFVEPDFIRSLISEIEEVDIVVPHHAKGQEPLIALYHKNCLGTIQTMLNENVFKVNKLFLKRRTKFVNAVNWTNRYPQLFRNLNRLEDF